MYHYAQNEHSLEINRRATKTEVKEWPILSLPPAADRTVSINLEHLGLAVGDPLSLRFAFCDRTIVPEHSFIRQIIN